MILFVLFIRLKVQHIEHLTDGTITLIDIQVINIINNYCPYYINMHTLPCIYGKVYKYILDRTGHAHTWVCYVQKKFQIAVPETLLVIRMTFTR